MAEYLTIVAFLVHVLLGCCAHHDHCAEGACHSEEVAFLESDEHCDEAGHQHAEEAHGHAEELLSAGEAGHFHSGPEHDGLCTEGECQFFRAAAPEIVSTTALVQILAIPSAAMLTADWAITLEESTGFHLSGNSSRSRCAQLGRWLV